MQLRDADLVSYNLFAVLDRQVLRLLQVFTKQDQLLLELHLLFKEIARLLLLVLEKPHNLGGSFLLAVELVLHLLKLLLLGIDLFGLELGLSHTLTGNLALDVSIADIEFFLIDDDLFDVSERHLLSTLQILDPALGNRDVDVHLVPLLVELVGDDSLLLDQVLIVQDPPLLIKRDVILLDYLVLLVDLARQLFLLNAALLSLLVLLVEHVETLNLTVHVRVLALDVGELLI